MPKDRARRGATGLAAENELDCASAFAALEIDYVVLPISLWFRKCASLTKDLVADSVEHDDIRQAPRDKSLSASGKP